MPKVAFAILAGALLGLICSTEHMSAEPAVQDQPKYAEFPPKKGSSQPRVEAWGFCQLSVFGNVIAKASARCAVLIDGDLPKVEGGQQTRKQIKTAADWCDYWGVKVEDGIAILYKGVDDSFRSPRNGIYTPGTIPRASDWDGGYAECGGGFHFSPVPAMTKEFFADATKFVACHVHVSDMRPPQDGDVYPNKIKASCVYRPIYEVDEDGEPTKEKEGKELQTA